MSIQEQLTEEKKKQLYQIVEEQQFTAIVSAVGKDQSPQQEVARKLTNWKDGRIAFYEFLESGQLQKNLVYSIWFDKEISITFLTPDGKNYQAKGKLYQDLMSGYTFEEEYLKALDEFGEETDLAHVWLLDVTSFEEQTYEVARAKEKREHPYLMHMDHIYKV